MILLTSNLRKTVAVTAVTSLLSAWVSFSIQNTANKSVGSCSYLDPITIDIVALLAGLFLFVEGLADIAFHRHLTVVKQSGRMIRICFGVSIVTIHIMQFLHK
jgi:hypothetical protein